MQKHFDNGMDDYDLRNVRVGAYVRIHPACDWFMRGVTGARVRAVGRKWLHVTATVGAGMGTNFKIRARDVLELTQ